MSATSNQIKTGSYAVTTVYSMPWAKKTVATPAPKRKKVEKKVVHEVFEECSELTKDTYWISIFKECARDKFPRGFSFKNGLMVHRRGNKIKRVIIPNNSPHEAFSIVVSFFKNSGGLMSIIDRKKLQKEEEERMLELTTTKDLQWKDIKTERVKEILISEYISEISLKKGFNKEKKIELSTTVKSGFMLKYFTGKNITMEDGKVTDITGLIYDKDKNRFYIDPKLTTKRPGRKVKGLGIEPVRKKPKASFISNWDKYLQGLDKANDDNFDVIEGSGLSLSGDNDDDNDTTPGDIISGNTPGNIITIDEYTTDSF